MCLCSSCRNYLKSFGIKNEPAKWNIFTLCKKMLRFGERGGSKEVRILLLEFVASTSLLALALFQKLKESNN